MKRVLYFMSIFIFIFTLQSSAQITGTNPQGDIRKKRESNLQNKRATPEQESMVLKYLEENKLGNSEKLTLLKERNPRLYNAKVLKLYREITFVESIKNSDPERYNQIMEERKLTGKSLKLAEDYKNTKVVSERSQIKQELESLLYKIFDLRQMNRKSEINRLEKKLNNLKEANQKRVANKKAIVEKRLQQLTGEKQYLQW
ncbi:hypothetical protein J7K93_08940 [bacterium]|nr:hypothetical protein [bacterium]